MSAAMPAPVMLTGKIMDLFPSFRKTRHASSRQCLQLRRESV
jgi:hypothetical protein